MTDPARNDSAPARPSQIDEKESKVSKDAPIDTAEPKEIGGRPTGLNPTRYGDWEKNGRCIDF